MPHKIKDLSGKEVVKFLEQNGFSVNKTRGSHCKISRTVLGRNQTLMIPLHSSIAKGTLHDIYNQTSEYLPGSDIKNFFFTE
ncbi:MAG: type II toxin-antitoxin system HicA family toxin [Candidatus Vogelbacteria bacterium]|nr:type II toxin-antitoxin system HicA family toxin [Candidatus Vogelbacteria bacterium]